MTVCVLCWQAETAPNPDDTNDDDDGQPPSAANEPTSPRDDPAKSRPESAAPQDDPAPANDDKDDSPDPAESIDSILKKKLDRKLSGK